MRPTRRRGFKKLTKKESFEALKNIVKDQATTINMLRQEVMRFSQSLEWALNRMRFYAGKNFPDADTKFLKDSQSWMDYLSEARKRNLKN